MPSSFDLNIKDEIEYSFKNAGIKKDDNVLIHADLRKNLIRFKKRDNRHHN